MDLKGKSILITGGTGSLGQALTKRIISKYGEVRRLIVFSRDEQKQFKMAQEFPEKDFSFMRYFIGDVRDSDRLSVAFKDVDLVIHAAAMKHVHIAEYNPNECIKTNVDGAKNVIAAAIENKVNRVVALSTDKACAPINLYGATKLVSDKLFVAANNTKGNAEITFSVVRYGNVMGSNGSVIPFFLKKRNDGTLPITHKDMTRFNIPIEEGVDMIFYALENSWGGEIFVPKIPSYRIMDLADAIGSKCEKKIIGIRPGEKIHEEMISESDSLNTYDLGDYYVILPSSPIWRIEDFLKKFGGTRVEQNFSYNSGQNDNWENAQTIRDKIKKHIDPDFSEQ
tara:strand:- start:4279 stop:5295 length:1017 start_codon:yes stop_codon:yes gene_type:complete